jgi:hypothetical protein
MRDKNFRRQQEAKHFRKRLNFYVKFGRFGSTTIKDTEGKLNFLEISRLEPKHSSLIGSTNKPVIKNSSFDTEAEKDERWTKKLKNGDVKFGWITSYEKKYCNRIRRKFQKTVDYQLPDNVFLDRCQVKYPSFDSEIIDEE